MNFGVFSYIVNENKNNPIVKSAEGKGQRSSTRFLIFESGLIANNHHVSNKAKKNELIGVNGDFTTINGVKATGCDEKNDLAILLIENKTIKFDSIQYTLGQ